MALTGTGREAALRNTHILHQMCFITPHHRGTLTPHIPSVSVSKSLCNSTSQNDHEDIQNQIKGINLAVKTPHRTESASSMLHGHLEAPFTPNTKQKS